MDQRELVERARHGEHDAFTSLVDLHLARLDAAARLILRDPELARDAVQDGFIKAWRNLPTLRDPDRFEAWLRRLVVRSCINTVRHRGRRLMEVELTPLHEPAISDIALRVASAGVRCGSSCMTRSTFSTTMMASSTTMPMASTSASSEMVLAE